MVSNYGFHTINNGNTYIGNALNNELSITDLNKGYRVMAGGGNDYVYGSQGNDRIWGDSGNDVLYGYAGNDFIHGGSDNDYLSGGRGSDKLYGSDGNDFLIGTDGTGYNPGEYDKLTGGKGSDTFALGDYNDVFYTTTGSGASFAHITDFNWTEGDKIQLHGSIGDYTVREFNLFGSSELDTNIFYQGNLIGVLEDVSGSEFFLSLDVNYVG